MTLKTRTLANIESDLQTRYRLAHVADTPRDATYAQLIEWLARRALDAL